MALLCARRLKPTRVERLGILPEIGVSMGAVDVRNDRGACGNSHATDFVVVDGNSIDHPERRIDPHGLFQYLRGQLQTLQPVKVDRPIAEGLRYLLPNLADVFRVSREQVERPSQRSGRGFVARNQQLENLGQDLFVVHLLAGVAVRRLQHELKHIAVVAAMLYSAGSGFDVCSDDLVRVYPYLLIVGRLTGDPKPGIL